MYLTIGAYNPEDLVPGSNTGFIKEPFYRITLLEGMRAGRVRLPFWIGSCSDSVEGDVGYMADTGVGFYVNPFEAGIKVNEFCGVWTNYIDSLLRTAGINFQEWTAGTERNVYLDWNLIWGYEGIGATLYDQLGYREAFSKSDAYELIRVEHQEAPGSGVTNTEPTNIAKEIRSREKKEGEEEPPEQDPTPEALFGFERLPFHSYQRWFGSVAPGQQSWFFAKFGTSESFPVPWAYRPLAHMGITNFGYCVIRSVNGILISKYPYIAAPIRLLDGDEVIGRLTPKQIENAAEALKVSEQDQNKKYTTLLCNTLYDIHNFIANWEGLLGFNIFTHKFVYITENSQHDNFADFIYPGERDGLGYKRRAPAFIYLDPYGNISLTNGAGSCIEMIGDTIRISAPGRILIDAGNNIKMFSNHIINLAERTITNIASNTIGSYIIRKNEELDRRVLAGLKLYEYRNQGYLLVPEDVITKIHTLYSSSVVARFVGHTEQVRSHDFVLDDLNPITHLNYPVQSWAWFYKDKRAFEPSEVVIPERWNVIPSTIDLETLVPIEPEPDPQKFRKKKFSSIFKPKVEETLLVNLSAINSYTWH